MVMEESMRQIYCNRCGKEIEIKNEIAQEDYIFIRKEWGYFSKKDGKTQEFLMCENCIKKLEEDFVIPSRWEDTIEMV